MAEYSIGPVEEPTWHIDAEDLAQRLRDRFPDARIRVNAAGGAASLEALIPKHAPQHELGIALHSNGQFVSLDPADPSSAAEFAVWFMRQVPANDPQIHFINPAHWPPLPLTEQTTEQEIIDFLNRQAHSDL